MKTIHTLQDTLALQLGALYNAECRIKSEIGTSNSFSHAGSENLREELRRYAASAEEKLLKLERIFNYLMQEPEDRKNKVIAKLLQDTKEMLSHTDSQHLRDILLVSCLQNINAYKISSVKIAYMFAVELDLDTAADLLQQILESELETSKSLARVAIEEFNKSQQLALI